MTTVTLTDNERLAIIGALNNQKRIKGAEKMLTAYKEKSADARKIIMDRYDIVLNAIDSALEKIS